MPFLKKIVLLICKGKKHKIYIVYFHNSRVMKHQNLLWKENLLHRSFLKTLDKYPNYVHFCLCAPEFHWILGDPSNFHAFRISFDKIEQCKL